VFREGLLRRDKSEEGKKRFIRLQVHPYRDSLTGLITPVALYLSVFTCREKAYIAKQKKRHG
jgi:hypothetical protein